jgi:hypothetical protein
MYTDVQKSHEPVVETRKRSLDSWECSAETIRQEIGRHIIFVASTTWMHSTQPRAERDLDTSIFPCLTNLSGSVIVIPMFTERRKKIFLFVSTVVSKIKPDLRIVAWLFFSSFPLRPIPWSLRRTSPPLLSQKCTIFANDFTRKQDYLSKRKAGHSEVSRNAK